MAGVDSQTNKCENPVFKLFEKIKATYVRNYIMYMHTYEMHHMLSAFTL